MVEQDRESCKGKITRRRFLKGLVQAGTTSLLAGCGFRPSPEPTQLPTINHDVTFIPSPRQESTPTIKENLIIKEEKISQTAPKETVSEYNLLSPEAFAPYAAVGGPETEEGEILDYFPSSYKNAADSLKGLWNQAIDAKLGDNPQKSTSLTVELETLPNKISFDYLLTPEGTRFFDIQEQEERIMLCDSNLIVIGKLEGEENFLAIYQEPVNSCYYFTQVGKDILEEQRALTASKNLITKPFIPLLQNLKEIGTQEERKRLYEVKRGDSLTTIARRFNLPSWHSLYGKNFSILRSRPELIVPDEKLDIPNKFSEEEFVDLLTPDFKRLSLSVDREIQETDSLYISQTGHYLSGEFLKFYEKWGESLLGYPISETTPDGAVQFFENMVLTYFKVYPFSYIPGIDKDDGEWRIAPVPIGWNLYYRTLNPKAEVLDKFPEIGQFELDEVFSDFYQQNGGLELLGFPISETLKSDDGSIEQWLTNSCLRYNPKDGKIELAPLGKRYFEKYYADKEFSWFKARAEEITITRALEIVKEAPRKIDEIEARTIGLLLYWQGYLHFPEREEKRDDLIFKYLAQGEEKNFVNVMSILAWHEARFEMNPVVEKVLDRLREGGHIINKLIQEKVPVEVFKDNKYPMLPEDWRGKFVFAGGTGFGGGLGYEQCPLVFGLYDKYRGYNPDDERFILEMFAGSGLHEAIHSFIQPASKIPHSNWLSKEVPKDSNFVPEDAREGLLAHMSMCLLTSAAQKYYGFKEEKDPRIDFILRVLKQGGVEDPEAEVIQAAVTSNGKRLWNIYEQLRKETDPSIDSLMSTQEPDLAIIQIVLAYRKIGVKFKSGS